MINDDGTVTPSFFINFNDTSGQQATYFDYSIKVGRITQIYYPTNNANANKKFTEYDVEATYVDGYGPPIKTVFYRCIVTSLFGGAGDFMRWTPRLDDTSNDNGQKILGSLVLVMCQNGNQRNGLIVGGIPHPETAAADLEELSFHTEFNGVNILINKDGELIVKHRGATNEKGKVDNTDGENSFFQMYKNGDMALGYLDKLFSDYASIQLIKASKLLKLFAKSDMESKTEAKFIVNTTSGVKVNPGDPDPQAWIRGTTYRRQQQIMNNTLKSLITVLSGLVQTAATSLTTAGASITAAAGTNAIPVVGGALSSPTFGSAGASVTVAGTSLISAASILTQMQTTIEQFEAEANSYLSNKHFFGESP